MSSDKQPCNCHPGCTKPLAERTRRLHRQKIREPQIQTGNEPLPAQLASLRSAAPSRLQELGLELMDDLPYEIPPADSTTPLESPEDSEDESDIEELTARAATREDSRAGRAQLSSAVVGEYPIDDSDETSTVLSEDRQTDCGSNSTSTSSRSSTPMDPSCFSDDHECQEYPVDDSTEPVLAPPSIEEAEATLTDWLGDRWRERIHDVLSDSLSPRDFLAIKAFALRMESNMPRSTYNAMRWYFQQILPIETDYLLYRRMDILSGLKPEVYHCCPDSCMAYTGLYEDLENCVYCKLPRYWPSGRPRATYWYIPLEPRFEGLYGNRQWAQTLMTYRATYNSIDDEISDIFDSENYKELRKKRVEIEGTEQNHFYFDNPTDVALGQSMDGVALFERSKNRCSATPIITVNYNLPPEIRTRSSNIMINAIIPGPKSPKDTDSFMYPMYKESHRLAAGVRMYNEFIRSSFIFRAYWIRMFGDMIAMMKMMEIKGHMAVRHCRRCLIIGTLGNGKTYYSPLVQPCSPDGDESDEIISWNPRALEMRSHQQVLAALKEIAEARTKKEKERLATFWGLTGKKSYIFRFPGADFISSTPFDFMHMMLSNNTKNYTKMLQGKFKDFDSGTRPGDYVIPADVWTEIGNELVAANRTIPSAFVSYLPDIWKERSSYTAELYSFWIVYAAPILLYQRLPSPYYEHLVKFGTIIKYCLKLTITTEELEELEELCISWVEDYERLYYQYDPSRLAFCTSNIHAMLHIPDDIRISGPLWTAWAFVMERICSLTVRAVKSRLNPFGSLNQYFKRIAQLTHIRNKYNLSAQLDPEDSNFGDDNSDDDASSGAPPPIKLSRFEEQVTGYTTTILRAPRQKQWVPNKGIRTKIAKYFVAPYNLKSWSHIIPHLPHTVQRWCKFRIDGGDSVRGSEATKNDQQFRDSSFVRFELLSSTNKRLVLYGQFHYAVVITLDPIHKANGNLYIPVKRTWILAYITPYKTGYIDATEALASFADRDAQTAQFFDIRTIQAVVGRIKTRDRWYVVDRSEGCARTVFVNDETPPVGGGGGGDDLSY